MDFCPQKLCVLTQANLVRVLGQWFNGGVADKVRVCAGPSHLVSGRVCTLLIWSQTIFLTRFFDSFNLASDGFLTTSL